MTWHAKSARTARERRHAGWLASIPGRLCPRPTSMSAAPGSPAVSPRCSRPCRRSRNHSRRFARAAQKKSQSSRPLPSFSHRPLTLPSRQLKQFSYQWQEVSEIPGCYDTSYHVRKPIAFKCVKLSDVKRRTNKINRQTKWPSLLLCKALLGQVYKSTRKRRVTSSLILLI